MLNKVEDLRQLVYTKMAPYKGAIDRQQELIYKLYKDLGHTDYSAWFACFKNAQDWIGLSEFIQYHQ